MIPDLYLSERSPPLGSSSYYACRLARRPTQALALYVLQRELAALIDIEEPQVAELKLAFWKSELSALPSGSSQHPLMQALAAEGFGHAVEPLLASTARVTIDREQSRFLDVRALESYLGVRGGAPAQALAQAALVTRSAALAAASELGAAIAHAQILMDVGLHARHQRIYLPHAALRDAQVPAADILAGRTTPALSALLAAEGVRARARMRRALVQLNAAERRALRALVVLAHLTRARLDEVERDGFRVGEHRITLTALRKVLIGLRVRVSNR